MEVSHDGDNITRLYEAANRGCVATLNELIRKDPLLDKVSLTPFTETPLHISSLKGHLDFTNAILEKYPKMASEFDSNGCSPLHLASAEGHNEIVKALLRVNKDVCLAEDQDGRISLHLAAMRGRIEVISRLVRAYPESISKPLHGDTVLHLCVKYYHLKALKQLVKDCAPELIKQQNQDGNTILHLAVMLKQSETIKYIVEEVGEKELASTKNKMGFTAMNVLENCPKDIKSYKIRDILMKLSSRTTKDEMPDTNKASVDEKEEKWWMKFARHLKHRADWIEKTRGSLMTVAALIAAMTYQSMVTPPGGVWQQDYQDNSTCKNNCTAGEAIFSYTHPKAFRRFMYCNSIAFIGSLVVIFLIMGGFPLQNKFFTWLFSVAMCMTILFTGYAYCIFTNLTAPLTSPSEKSIWESLLPWLIGALGLIFLLSFIHIWHFLVWLHKTFEKYWKNKFYKKRAEQQRGFQQENV